MDVQQVLTLLCQALDALACLHAQGSPTATSKPANILVSGGVLGTMRGVVPRIGIRVGRKAQATRALERIRRVAESSASPTSSSWSETQ